MKQLFISEMHVNCICLYKFLNVGREGVCCEKKANFYRLLYLESGVCDFFVANKKYSMKGGDLLFIPAGTKYSTDFHGKEMKMYNVLFSFLRFSKGDNYRDGLKYDIYSDLNALERVEFCDYPEFNACHLYEQVQLATDFKMLEREYLKRDKFSLLKINTKLMSIMLQLMEGRSRIRSDGLYEKIVEYIKENILEDITCASIAAHFNYHPNYLNRIVKANSGKSLHYCLTENKCLEATKLLLATDKTITEIAQDLSFCSSSHFTNVFVKIIGIIPREYRKAYR